MHFIEFAFTWLFALLLQGEQEAGKSLLSQLEQAVEKGVWLVYTEGEEGPKSGKDKAYYSSLGEFLQHVQKEYLVSKASCMHANLVVVICIAAKLSQLHSFGQTLVVSFHAWPAASCTHVVVSIADVRMLVLDLADCRICVRFPAVLVMRTQDGKLAQADLDTYGMVCRDIGPGLLDAYKMDFGDKLADEAARALRRTKKAGSDQANGCYLQQNAWMQAFSEVRVCWHGACADAVAWPCTVASSCMEVHKPAQRCRHEFQAGRADARCAAWVGRG